MFHLFFFFLFFFSLEHADPLSSFCLNGGYLSCVVLQTDCCSTRAQLIKLNVILIFYEWKALSQKDAHNYYYKNTDTLMTI